jgi:hypothetical protein
VKRRSEMDIETRLSEYFEMDGFQCPAAFWPALGYTESARYVAIWWERGGDEASWSDGRDMVIGAEWPAYHALLAHNFAPDDGARWLFGSSDDAAEFYLVIDRETERAWMVPAELASQVLQLQWPVHEVAPLPSDSMAEWLAMLQRQAARVRPPSIADVERIMAESQTRYEALVAALEERKRIRASQD